MTTIGTRLRALRMEKEWSQAEVAKMLNVSRATYVQYETGVNAPTRKLSELAQLYNVTTDYLLGRTDIKKNIFPTVGDGSKFSKDQKKCESEQEKRDATARELLRLLCKDNSQALAIIDRISISANGDISLPDADKVDEAVIKALFTNFVSALQNAKPTGNGTMVAEMNIPKTE